MFFASKYFKTQDFSNSLKKFLFHKPDPEKAFFKLISKTFLGFSWSYKPCFGVFLFLPWYSWYPPPLYGCKDLEIFSGFVFVLALLQVPSHLMMWCVKVSGIYSFREGYCLACAHSLAYFQVCFLSIFKYGLFLFLLGLFTFSFPLSQSL